MKAQFNSDKYEDDMPYVTIVTPVYNQARFIENTMRSVLEQNYPALEYIVIDDGSTDDSLEVAKSVAKDYNRKVTVIAQKNLGQAATLNKGWDMASGEIIGYLSSDDCLLPNAIKYLVDALTSKTETVVAYSDYWIINNKGHRIKPHKTEEFELMRLNVNLVCQPGPGALFKKIIYKKTGGWNISLKQVPDFEFWLRAVEYGSFIRVPYFLAEYRIHDDSASFRQISAARADEIIEVTRNYWALRLNRNKANEALAHAYSLSAKNHAQSGRIYQSIINIFKGFWIYPKAYLKFEVWRPLLSGLGRQVFYRIMSYIK